MDLDALDLSTLLDTPSASPAPSPRHPRQRRRPPSSRPRCPPLLDDLDDLDDPLRPALPPAPAAPGKLLLEARVVEYMNIALANLRDDFGYELRSLLEGASVIEPTVAQFITGLVSEIRQEIALRAPAFPPSIDGIDLPLALPEATFADFPSLAEAISQLSAHASVLAAEFAQSKAELARVFPRHKHANDSVRSSNRLTRQSRLQLHESELEAMRLTLDAEKARLGLARDELQRKIETFELSQYEKAREREFFVNLHSELLDLNGVFADRKRTQLDRKLRLQLESLVCDAADQRMWEQKLVQTVVRMTDIAGVVSRQEALLYSPVSPFGDGIPPSILRTPMRPLVLDRVQVPSPADRLGLNTSAPIDEPV